MGTAVVLFLFPLASIGATIISIAFAILAPLWVPIATLVLHLYMMFVYDLDSPDNSENKYCTIIETIIWNIIIQGCIQPIAAILVALILCPLAAVFICLCNYTIYFYMLKYSYLYL